ncbi:MAG: hypothetical protein JST39_18965 [Bacteroidetes bacterium]|nr:hypothetical protein [Bacteroidota bacterium]
MENRNTILNELRDISPALPDLGAKVPYTVPAGYFDSLAAGVLLRINTEARDEQALAHIAKTPVYEVPAGYFDTLADTILNRIRASAAATPADELAHLSPLLSGLGRKSPFSMPEGYFNELSENVVSGVQAIEFVNEELENLSPLMASLKTINVYEAPAGYFEQLSGKLLSKVQKEPAKIVSISFRKRVMQYAAAAVIAGAIAVAGYVGFKGKTTADTGVDPKALAKVSDNEIESFLTDNTIALADAGTIVTNTSINESDAKDLLANVSDDELQSYLEEHGVSNKPVTN